MQAQGHGRNAAPGLSLLKQQLESSGKRLPKELQPFLDRLEEILGPAREHIKEDEPGGKT